MKKRPPLLSSTSEGPAAAAGGDGGTAAGGAVGASAGAVAGPGDGAARGGEQGRASRARRKQKRPLAAAGRVLRGARRVLRWAVDGLLVVLVVKGSVPVVKNMAGVGGGQKMNQNFDRCARQCCFVFRRWAAGFPRSAGRFVLNPPATSAF